MACARSNWAAIRRSAGHCRRSCASRWLGADSASRLKASDYLKRLCSRRPIWPAVVLVATLVSAAAASAYLQRTVNGPASVVPGHVYTFYVSGFSPGERIYATVQPVSCAQTSERCEEDPCAVERNPHCSIGQIGPSGSTNVRFRWPKTSVYAFANMDIAQYRWRLGSRALVRIDLVARRVPPGCQRMPSITANPQAGSVVCAATLTQIK